MTPARKAEVAGTLGAWVIRLLTTTLRFEIEDRCGALQTPAERPLLWSFWHNRQLVIPHLFRRCYPDRPGAALTSASKDGEVVAAMLKSFGFRPIRGSSSRRGAAALIEMKRAIERGFILGITPDGPRGPRYRLNPGVIKLAQITGASVLLVHVTYSRFWQLKTWDGFMIPKPFARVQICFEPMFTIAPTATGEAFEAERARVEAVLRPDDVAR